MADNLAATPTVETHLMPQSTTLRLGPSMDVDRPTLRWPPLSPQPGRVVLDEENWRVVFDWKDLHSPHGCWFQVQRLGPDKVGSATAAWTRWATRKAQASHLAQAQQAAMTLAWNRQSPHKCANSVSLFDPPPTFVHLLVQLLHHRTKLDHIPPLSPPPSRAAQRRLGAHPRSPRGSHQSQLPT